MTKVLEVCVDNYESALAAIAGGANRLELCSALQQGGLTPTPGLLKQVQQANSERIPVFCMLRCRPSNFVYTDEEIKIMVNDAKILKLNGADGFVFGAMTEEKDVDLKKCRDILKTCYPLPVTFHRAFDLCRNPVIQVEVVIDLGFQRLLTSGTKKTALEGCDIIKKLMDRVRNRLVIMPGCGITKDNIKEIMETTCAKEYHGSFKAENSEDKNDVMDLGTVMMSDRNYVAEAVQILKS